MHSQKKRTQKLCTYPEGIVEYAGIMEKAEIKVKTKVVSRQEPHQNR